MHPHTACSCIGGRLGSGSQCCVQLRAGGYSGTYIMHALNDPGHQSVCFVWCRGRRRAALSLKVNIMAWKSHDEIRVSGLNITSSFQLPCAMPGIPQRAVRKTGHHQSGFARTPSCRAASSYTCWHATAMFTPLPAQSRAGRCYCHVYTACS